MTPILAAWFVAPWFAFAGAALASIPIIIHILNRRRFKTVRWAAMEYLLQAMRKNRRRLKFEQWLLLATRRLHRSRRRIPARPPHRPGRKQAPHQAALHLHRRHPQRL